jgi:hypothetical protein
MYYSPSLYLKNGVVVDSNGSWPLKQPTAGAIAPTWASDPIPFATGKWTDGDCTPKPGVAYYRYSVTTGYFQNTYETIGMNLAVSYAVKQCGGVKLFTGSTIGDATASQFKSNRDLNCDPIGATFAFPDPDHLAPPWLSASVAFDVDEDSGRMCGCRACDVSQGKAQGTTYPTGDVKATYRIDDGVNVLSGSIILKKKAADAPSGFIWAANAGWWLGPTCGGTLDPGDNIVLTCGSLRFLKWCENVGFGAPGTKITSSKPGETRYALVDPTSDKPNQGAVVLTDVEPFGGVCCAPCAIPKKDLKLTLVRHFHGLSIGPGGFPTLPIVDTYATVMSTTLFYHEVPQDVFFGTFPTSSAMQFARWASDEMAPGNPVRLDLGILATTKGTWRFDCLVPPGPGDPLQILSNLSFTVRRSTPIGLIDDFRNLSVGGFGSANSTCEPLHLEIVGGQVGDETGYYQYTAYLDEAE